MYLVSSFGPFTSLAMSFLLAVSAVVVVVAG